MSQLQHEARELRKEREELYERINRWIASGFEESEPFMKRTLARIRVINDRVNEITEQEKANQEPIRE